MTLGQGKQDLQGILQALRDISYDGWITTELDEYAGDPKDAAQHSKEFLESAR